MKARVSSFWIPLCVLGVQTCKPGTHPGSHPPYSPPFHPRQHGRGVQPAGPHPRCEPQTLQTSFSGWTVAQCCARASRIGFRPGRTPFAWGICSCADYNERLRPSPSSQPSQAQPRCDDGDGCDGWLLLFTSPKTQTSLREQSSRHGHAFCK